MRFRLVVDGEAHEIDVTRTASGLSVQVDGIAYRAFVAQDAGSVRVRVGAGKHDIAIRRRSLTVDGRPHEVTVHPEEAETSLGPEGSGPTGKGLMEIRPPMPGRVVKLPLAPGSPVRQGQAVAVLEAMKMQNEIPSPADGTVREIRVREGETIGADRVIAVIESS